MRASFYIPMLAALCLAAIGVGVTIGRATHPAAFSVTPAAVEKHPPIGSNHKGVTLSQLLAAGNQNSGQLRAIASKSTGELWTLFEQEGSLLAALELLDRLGSTEAMRCALKTEDPQLRIKLTETMLNAYASKDVWGAFDFYLAHRDAIDPLGGRSDIPHRAVAAACSISADKLIECMEACRGKDQTTGIFVKFGPGFDFRKVLDYLCDEKNKPRVGPARLVEGWAAVDPIAALAWAGQKDEQTLHHLPDAEGEAPWRNAPLVHSIIEGSASTEDRRQALLSLSEADRNAAWQYLTKGTWATASQGALDPKFLDVADVLGSRQDYLAIRLLDTRGLSELDPSWDSIPPTEREQTLDRALARWSAAEPTTVGANTRAAWEDWIRKSWIPGNR